MQDPEFANFTIPEMIRSYNEMIMTAIDLGMTGKKTRTSFHDRTDGLARCEALHSSIKAFRSGMKAEETRPEGTSPGLVRMQNNLGPERTEALRAQTVEQQQQALADAGTGKEPAMGKKKEVKKARGRAAGFGGDQHITVLAEKNPKREGTSAHEAFSHYRSGMRVDTFCEKAGDGAMAHLRWDAQKGYIKVG